MFICDSAAAPAVWAIIAPEHDGFGGRHHTCQSSNLTADLIISAATPEDTELMDTEVGNNVGD